MQEKKWNSKCVIKKRKDDRLELRVCRFYVVYSKDDLYIYSDRVSVLLGGIQVILLGVNEI